MTLTMRDEQGDARGACLVAALGLSLFALYVGVVRAAGWLAFPVVPVILMFAGLAALNVALGWTASRWARSRTAAWAYEGFHALALTYVLHLFGGLSMGIYLMVYGFLVVHTEVLRPDASPFVTANLCGVLYGALAVAEHMHWTAPAPLLPGTLTPGHRLVFVSFAILSFNFLALYAERHGNMLRELATRLESMVERRTSDLRRANESLTTIATALRQKQAEVQTFAYTVTHDLKNPLNAISLLAHLLVEREGRALSPEGREDLAQIARTAAQGENMLRDLLNLFRVAERPETRQEVDLDSLVREAVTSLRPQLTTRHASLTVDALPVVWGQPGKLRHVITNLLENAVKYVPPSGGAIAISAERRNGDVVLHVRDNGIGIPEPYHHRIFDLFGRVPDGQQLVAGCVVRGTGVGLALVKRIVEDHDGAVWVDSTPGRGSCFHVRLPSNDPTAA